MNDEIEKQIPIKKTKKTRVNWVNPTNPRPTT
jgi:hypothetical protein